MTRSQHTTLPSTPMDKDADPGFTAAYVQEMALELADLARSAGYLRLSALLTLASLENEAGRQPIGSGYHRRSKISA
jgi:hypothetical protein